MGGKTRRGARLLPWVLLLGIVGTASGWQPVSGSRRQFVAAAVATATGALVSPEASTATSEANNKGASPSSLVSQLISVIPAMNNGAPATNRTISRELSSKIENLASAVENTAKQRDNVRSPLLSGSWRLLYSNAPEIVSLAKGIPLGFELGPTYQPLDTARGFFENTASVTHPYGLGALRTIVVGTVAPATKGGGNAVGVINDANNRVDVNFEAIVFELDTVLGRTLVPPLRKTLVPNASKDASEGTAAPPANDQTYLDETVRIVRGGDGSLFVFSRDDANETMMTETERAELLASRPSSGTPVGEDLEREKAQPKQRGGTAVPAEIKYLFQFATKEPPVFLNHHQQQHQQQPLCDRSRILRGGKECKQTSIESKFFGN